MERTRDVLGYNTHEAVVMEDMADYSDAGVEGQSLVPFGRTPGSKARSLSDSGGTPSKLSPAPLILEASRRTSKDDSNLRDLAAPVTPQRQGFLPGRGFALNLPPRAGTPPPAGGTYVKPAPLSPKLDHSQIYASPTNILPRRSRGLDFSRAATSLHHSTLAEQSSPDSSPTMGGRAMNIPGRRSSEFGRPEQTSSSLWSMMGNQEKLNISGSLGSTQAIASDSSSSEDEDMDEDMEDTIMTTPQMSRASNMGMPPVGAPFGSPAMSSLMSFQQRQRPRKHNKKKPRGPLGFGYNTTPSMSKSPPQGLSARRESISWQANQLHISGADSDENARNSGEAENQNGDGRTIVRRVTSRRGNLLPKTKNFARIRAALAEETAPADIDVRHEAEVIKQVRESDPVPEPRVPANNAPSTDAPAPNTAASSPNLNHQDSLDDIPEDDMMGDLAAGLSSSFKQQAVKNSKGKNFWENFSESSSMGGARTTPPPMAFLPRGSSSGVSEDLAMDSPSLAGMAGFPSGSQQQQQSQQPPSAAEITRRINKRRRDDTDLDPVSFKRRAVSPGFSVHNSPIMQSPMQRDNMPWGSRPGSNGADRAGSSAQSDSGSVGGGKNGGSGGGSGGTGGKRIGFQGMVDTNDGIMRMSIE